MLTDAAGVGLALLAAAFAARPATPERTFGYMRFEILAAVINALLLFAVAGFVMVEAVRRFREPPELSTVVMLTVAGVGLVANAGSLLMLRGGQHASLNVRGAYLEVLGDLLGSAAVIVAAIVIRFTGFTQADAIASAAIGLMILPRTWGLLREAVGVLLEATPKGVDLTEVRQHINQTPGVIDVHDLHAWTITSGLPVLSAHIVITEDASPMAAVVGSWTSSVSASQATSTSSTAPSSSRPPVTASTNYRTTPDLGRAGTGMPGEDVRQRPAANRDEPKGRPLCRVSLVPS